MFSPSDYNDAVPQFTNGNYANTPQNPLYVEEPDADNYNRGAEPLQTLPVQWWNWLCNKITAKLNNLNIYVKNIFNELAALLSLVNVTPDATEEAVTTEQLKDMFATKYPQYLQDNFKTEPLLQGRTRGVMVAPTDTWNDNTDTLSLTGGSGIINTYNKVTFSDCNLVIPTDNRVHFIVSNTRGVISIQNSIANNVILIGLCSNKQYCLLIDNNPDQCKDNIILKKWFGQNNISQNFVSALQSYYDTAIASIETNISIKTISTSYGIPEGIYNNCTINIEKVSVGGTGINSGTFNNCTINIGTITNGNGITGGTLNNCTITIKTVNGGSDYGFGIHGGTLDNCTITIETVESNGYGIYECTLNNCTITIKTITNGYGISNGTLNNCTITIGTIGVGSGYGFGIYEDTLDNCTITIGTIEVASGIYYGTFNNCTITIKTVKGGSGYGYGINECTLDNCTITIGTVNREGRGVYASTLDNCTITIETVSGIGISNGTYNNCTFTIKTVNNTTDCFNSVTLNNCTIYIESLSGNGINGDLNNCTITIKTVISGGKGISIGNFYNCTITIKTVRGYGIFGGTFDNCTIIFETVTSSGRGVDSGTYNNCTFAIETVNGGIVINNDSIVILYFTYIKCPGISSLSNTGGKLNILNNTVFHSN